MNTAPTKTDSSKQCKCFKICIGIILIALGIFVVEGTIGIVLIILGVIAVIFGVTGYCPCNALGKGCCSSNTTEEKDKCCIDQTKEKNNKGD